MRVIGQRCGVSRYTTTEDLTSGRKLGVMSSLPKVTPQIGGALDRGAAEELARTLRAVADPTRLQILSIILGSVDERATVGQLADVLGLRQPTVTHHVRILLDDGFLTRQQDGKQGWLSVIPTRRSAIEDFLR